MKLKKTLFALLLSTVLILGASITVFANSGSTLVNNNTIAYGSSVKYRYRIYHYGRRFEFCHSVCIINLSLSPKCNLRELHIRSQICFWSQKCSSGFFLWLIIFYQLYLFYTQCDRRRCDNGAAYYLGQ